MISSMQEYRSLKGFMFFMCSSSLMCVRKLDIFQLQIQQVRKAGSGSLIGLPSTAMSLKFSWSMCSLYLTLMDARFCSDSCCSLIVWNMERPLGASSQNLCVSTFPTSFEYLPQVSFQFKDSQKQQSGRFHFEVLCLSTRVTAKVLARQNSTFSGSILSLEGWQS